MASVYKIESKTTGKCYIGITKGKVKYRWKRHLTNASKNVKYHFYHAIRKYGIEDFTCSTIEECDISILHDREKYWIAQFDSFENGYNSTLGGEGFGYNFDDPIIHCMDKYSLKRYSVKQSVFNADSNLVGLAYGTKQTEETNKKRSILCKQNRHTDESKRKIRAGIAKAGKPKGNRRKGVIDVYNYKHELVAENLHHVQTEQMFCRALTLATIDKPLGRTNNAKGHLNKNNHLDLIGHYIKRETNEKDI